MMDTSRSPRLPTILRIILGIIWIAGAIVNLFVTLPKAAASWNDLGEDATFGAWRWFFDDVVGSAPELWTLRLVAGELLLGALLLGKDPWARYGLVLSTLWCVFLFFLIWPWTLSTAILLVASVWLMKYRHPVSFADLFRRHTFDVGMKGTRV